METPKKERRRHKRYKVEGVHGNVLHPSDLIILNMSIDGAAIETSKRLDINREYIFKIKHKGTILSFRGLVIWSILTNKEIRDQHRIIPVYRAGIRFTDTLNDKASQLVDFIEENKSMKLERRGIGVRFKINSPQNVKIEYPYKYEVKRMSLSGMLVETEYPLKINSRYHIEIFLDKSIINLVGRVANCEEVTQESGTKYKIGIEFTKIPDEKREIIKEFLKTLS